MSRPAQPVVLCLAPTGLAVARRAARVLGGELCVRVGIHAEATAVPETGPFLRDAFHAGRPIVGVCAAAILVRSLASCLGDKRHEPPVVAGAETGSTWIPLLGGHRGANDIAFRLATTLGGHAAVTTAGDLKFGVALDQPPSGWNVVHAARAGPLMSSLLSGNAVAVGGSEAERADWLAALPKKAGPPDVVVGMEPVPPGTLGFVPRRAALGVGCVRGCDPEALRELAFHVLQEAGIIPEALCGVFSIDLKSDEAAVIALAQTLRAPLRFFPASELESEAHRLANPSEVVFREVGCHGVAEAAALAGAGAGAALRVEKRKFAGATCAMALAKEPISRPSGKERGRLMLVSAGPGSPGWRTPEACHMVADADELVGYGPYLELLGPIAKSKSARAFQLGEEEARCQYALARAAGGRKVALICSGDAGIYAMASLVYELLARNDASPTGRAHAVEVVVGPGVTAATAAAARAGAPLGHDFCVISLSDLLTPRKTILNRVKAAARADFVVAFYNPASRRRQSLLEEARDILLCDRPPGTPIAIARSVGRADEHVRHETLGALRSSMADMHTVVLVGSSNTVRIRTPDGPRLYTPRGYGSGISDRNMT